MYEYELPYLESAIKAMIWLLTEVLASGAPLWGSGTWEVVGGGEARTVLTHVGSGLWVVGSG